jgi:hypothetical protein
VFLANLIVLAELAAEITIGKKDGARTIGPRQNGLFTKVRKKLRYGKFITGTTDSPFPLVAINTAYPRTE